MNDDLDFFACYPYDLPSPNNQQQPVHFTTGGNKGVKCKINVLFSTWTL
jgi:hypothetical protein